MATFQLYGWAGGPLRDSARCIWAAGSEPREASGRERTSRWILGRLPIRKLVAALSLPPALYPEAAVSAASNACRATLFAAAALAAGSAALAAGAAASSARARFVAWSSASLSEEPDMSFL